MYILSSSHLRDTSSSLLSFFPNFPFLFQFTISSPKSLSNFPNSKEKDTATGGAKHSPKSKQFPQNQNNHFTDLVRRRRLSLSLESSARPPFVVSTPSALCSRGVAVAGVQWSSAVVLRTAPRSQIVDVAARSRRIVSPVQQHLHYRPPPHRHALWLSGSAADPRAAAFRSFGADLGEQNRR
ncbi:hypothetical protein AAHA92_33797 [Salvia divinorum]|uniref:Uncharacterized protein n=1 Tax=Salvia divinorum TaxID=28513 RepID=A0ABD1FGW7_SALDI